MFTNTSFALKQNTMFKRDEIQVQINILIKIYMYDTYINQSLIRAIVTLYRKVDKVDKRSFLFCFLSLHFVFSSFYLQSFDCIQHVWLERTYILY